VWSIPCTRDESAGFLVEPQNQGRRFISGLTLKPLERFPDFDLKITAMVSFDLASKPVDTVSWFGPQNQVATVCRLRHKTDRRMKTA
jgi:hypothetical protein